MNEPIFDPFGDFAVAGYLRNKHGSKNMDVVKAMEHHEFLAHLPEALDWISDKPLDYDTLLGVHKILFGGFYPWAGRDRLSTTPDRVVSKGSVDFSSPEEIHDTFVRAMHQPTAGTILAGLAYAHPFLDGNGRALFLFFCEHQRRQKTLIRFDQIDPVAGGEALSLAIAGHPNQLDELLKQCSVPFPFRGPETERLSRVFASIDWSNQGIGQQYIAKPTIFHKIFSGFKK